MLKNLIRVIKNKIKMKFLENVQNEEKNDY